MPYFVILLCLMPDDFISQRKSVSTLLVINFFGFTILFIKRNCVGHWSIWISPVYYFTIFAPKTQGECLMVYFFLSKLSHKRREKVLDISGTMDNNMTMSIWFNILQLSTYERFNPYWTSNHLLFRWIQTYTREINITCRISHLHEKSPEIMFLFRSPL